MTEIEAKFIIRRPGQIRDALRVLSAAGWAASDRREMSYVDRYFDTGSWSILASGWACRTRQHDRNNTLTLKSLQGGDGHVFVREEVSQALHEQDLPAQFCLPAGPVRQQLDGIVDGTPVAELFRLTCQRTAYRLRNAAAEPVIIELDIDEARIEADKATEKATGVVAFIELELELKSGSASDLGRIARLLRDRAGLMPAHFSKFERGLQAAGLEIETLLETQAVAAITEDDSILLLLYDYFREQLGIVRRQHPRALEGIDPEGVHQMRVATRRLRAILKAFRGVLGDDVVSRFNTELRWLAGNLGRARDADVTERNALDAAAAGAGHYETFLQQETVSAYEHLVEILQSERCAALERDLERLISAGPTVAMQEQFGNLSVTECARQFVGLALAKLLTHGDAIDAESPARQLHKLRIEAKRFRYLLDFFSTVQADRWAQLTEAVKKLQDVLGEHQDAVTAQARLADYAATLTDESDDRGKRLATARLMQGESERIAASRQQFATAWSEFRAMVT